MKTRKQPVVQEQQRSQSSGEFNSLFWDFFIANEYKRFVVLVGGAGSGKSYSTAQWLIRKMITETGKKFLIVRKTFPSLKITAMQLILDLLDGYGIPYTLNQSAPVTLRVNGNEVIFRGLDDPEKVKSFEPNYIWMEETSDFTIKDFRQLNLRLRRPNDKKNQIFMSLNPVDKTFSWIYEKFFEHINERAATLHSTWLDNWRYLDPEYITELKALKEEDRTTYEIYTLGLWGVLENIIYTNYETISAFPGALGDRFYGLDFGYIHPTALVEIRYVNEKIFEQEKLYQTHLTNPELIDKLKVLIENPNDCIYADNAEPGRIQEIRKAGFNIYPARKDVQLGIDFVKRFQTHIITGGVYDSANLLKEKKGYRRKEDKDGNVLEEPVKFKDDLMDAERYAMFTHLWRLYGKQHIKDRREPITKDTLGVP